MTKAYRSTDADRLIPLLRSIQRELREREHEIKRLETNLRAARRERRKADELATLQARLADQRRELRLATKELDRLGCRLDEGDPRRVLIPGSSGELVDGFCWSPGDLRVQSLVAGELT